MIVQRKTGSASPDLNEILSATPLPAMPDSAIRLLEISGDPSKDAVDLAKPIEADAGMATQLLRFCNSSYFGLRHQISSVQQAVSMLGISKVKNFVLWNAVFTVVPDPKSRQFSMMTFRCDALRRGLFARGIAGRLAGADAEDAFTGGLLQDIALPVLIKQFGEPYLMLLRRCAEEGVSLADVETEAFGWTHADAGGVLLERWNLPKVLLESVRTHAAPETLAGETCSPTATAVALSSLLPSFRDETWGNIARLSSSWDQLSLSGEPSLANFLIEIDEAFSNLSQALNVGAGGQTLEALHNDATATCDA